MSGEWATLTIFTCSVTLLTTLKQYFEVISLFKVVVRLSIVLIGCTLFRYILCVCDVKVSGECLSLRCGSGLSGDYLSEEGHYWVGVDISTAMLG